MLNLLDQEGSSSLQGTPEALNISLHVESEFSFQPRIRNPLLRTMSFDIEISEPSVEISEYSIEISESLVEISKTSVEAGKNFNAYTENNFFETSIKSSKDMNNTFEDYLAPDFEFLLDSAEAFEDTRFA